MRVGRLRDKMILASLILIVPFLLWNLLLQASRFHEQYMDVVVTEERAARDVGQTLADHVLDIVAMERGAGLSLWDGKRAPSSGSSAYLAGISRTVSHVKHLSVADAKGVVLASETSVMIGSDHSRDPAVRRVIQGADWALSNAFASPLEKRPVVGVAAGIRDKSGRLKGIVLALTDEAYLEAALLHEIVSTEEIIITDANGVVIVSHGLQELGLSHRRWSVLPFVRRALAGRSSVIPRLRMPNGDVLVGVIVPVKGCGWTAAVLTRRSQVMCPMRLSAIWNGGLIILIIGLFIASAFVLGNRLTKPVLDLAGAARLLGQGDLSARAGVATGDELQYLAQSFNDMADALEERTEQLNAALHVERHQAERISALYDVAQVIITTMDLDKRLGVIAQALASLVHAGRSAIFLKAGNHLVGATGWNLARMDLFRELSYDIGTSGEFVMKAGIEGTPQIVRNVATDPRIKPAGKLMLAELGVKGFLALPLVWKDRLVGVATLDNPEKDADFDEEDIENARGLADLAAIAIENAQIYEKERNIAQSLQHSLLPESCKKMGKYNIACEYHAALEVAQLGGDLYDIVEHPDGRIGIVIADVSGKGLEAAVFTAMTKYTLRAFASEDPEPGSTLRRANDSMAKVSGEWGFVTTVYGLLDPRTGSITVANAGHPPCLIIRASGDHLELKGAVQSLPLGIMPDVEYVECEDVLETGDVLVGYTDGVTDARRDGEPYEVERLVEVIKATRHVAPEEIARAIYESVLEYSSGSLQDDIALVVIKRDEE